MATTIVEENRKTLRKSMRVVCDFQETDTQPNITPVGIAAEYEGLAGVDSLLENSPQLMDLAGDGFLNDGQAEPMQTDTDSFRYGYISEEAATAGGTFPTPFGVTLSTVETWDVVTLEIAGEDGNVEIRQVNPIWSDNTTTILIDRWTPGQRAIILGVHLGMYWRWDNSTLISVDLDLHGVGTEVGGDLEISSIDIQAYEPNDYTDVIGRIPKTAPIRYSAGYTGDMSPVRKFYLSDDVSWDNNVLNIKGQDATMLMEGKEVPVVANYDDYDAGELIGDRIRTALSDINYLEVGNAPDINMTTSTPYVFQEASRRSLISLYMNVYGNSDYIKPIYVDAGIPVLYWTDIPNIWTISSDEISELDIIVEENINTIKATIEDYYSQYNDDIKKVKATANRTYLVHTENPVEGIQNVSITPTPTSVRLDDGKTIRFKAAATATYTVEAWEVLVDLTDDNDPYIVQDSEKGVEFTFDEPLPIMLADIGSVTKKCLPALLNRSNIVYEFEYRGNPHIQPRDTLNVEIATWENVEVVTDGLFPETDLYPATDLYPDATYKEARKMVTEWVTMTVDTITIEHQEGGTTSKVRARKGAV